ncbi:MAG: ADP-ribosyltransferase domain-containing protein, partial [Gemmataceae bacterium]
MSDPYALAELFQGGGEAWLPVLKPLIEAQPDADLFIGPKRDPRIVPVRELTFQALKPHAPADWNVVVFGQNPYPRAESATGIAMFDNTFTDWKDSQFGKVMSIRCIIKAACMWKHQVVKQTPIADMRKLLAAQKTVQPPAWFQAMLTQGVLLLNASLTASSDGDIPTDRHTQFWRPVAEAIVEEILRAKGGSGGVVFAWWGAHARALRVVVERLQRKYPGVAVRHVEHCNPAAQGDLFCDGDPFGGVNAALKALKLPEVDWLPSAGWDAGKGEAAQRMGSFIASTMELHKTYLERLEDVKDEVGAELPAIVGILDAPVVPFADAVVPVLGQVGGLEGYVRRSQEFGRVAAGRSLAGLTADEVAALHLYTCETAFYRRINAALRDAARTRVAAFYPYLRLFLSALGKLPGRPGSLWRGVNLDLLHQYPLGATVVWWGVSSCTPKLSVAQGFLGGRGRRTLFEVRPLSAFSIKNFSAFTGEEECVLPPGTRLKVAGVASEKSGLCTV